MSQPGRSQEPERRLEASAPRARGGWPPPGSRVPGAGNGRVRRVPSPGSAIRRAPSLGPAVRRARLRTWPAGGRDRGAARRAELAALEQGIRFRTIFLLLMGTILAIAATDVLSGAAGLVRETGSRPLTPAEQARYIRDDIARRWHAWPADLVFPVELQYIGLGRVQQYARRVGLAPEVACAAGTDAPVGSVLAQHGCRTLLRATYVDQTSTFVVTVGIAVLDDEERRSAATGELARDDRVGVRPVAFPGTATELFGAAQRQRTTWVGVGPYIVFSTAGYTDGRTRESVSPEEILHSELWPTAQAVAGRIARALGDEPSAVPRCTRGNVC
ncbi:hypothetical protein FHS43_004846 [Streptosporangium becharense]|uniref:Uncharacterized protein n=1 Tax=Streptosporangium becharense TaxID=1816182 RepID=A0A7W9MHK4_9ACTN|nr:hypothetical protein [Streptosporangium becharense]MBB2913542.1 hypothetical protein [Streptosporangium becharense]MBB5821232.1 hypothetical protein [Streptosporangium becharense]